MKEALHSATAAEHGARASQAVRPQPCTLKDGPATRADEMVHFHKTPTDPSRQLRQKSQHAPVPVAAAGVEALGVWGTLLKASAISSGVKPFFSRKDDLESTGEPRTYMY